MLLRTAVEFRNDLFFRNILHFYLYIQNYLIHIQRTQNYNQHDIITQYNYLYLFQCNYFKLLLSTKLILTY